MGYHRHMAEEEKESLREHLTPYLDGQELTVGSGSSGSDLIFRWPNGQIVDNEHHNQIVFVNASAMETADNWWANCGDISLSKPIYDDPMKPVTVKGISFGQDDIVDMLMVIGSGATTNDAVSVDAGFFHRTLGRFIGFWNDSAPQAIGVQWNYDFWKAELREKPAAAAPEPQSEAETVCAYEVSVFRGEQKPPVLYNYWIATDSDGKITRSAWLSAPPDFLGEGSGSTGFGSEPPTERELQAIFDDGNDAG
jgi:hypothetical protein